MKRLLVFIALLAMILCVCFVFVSCNVQTDCIHPNGWETIEEQDSTCTTVGYKWQVCLDCGLENIIEIPVKLHEYEEVGVTPATCEIDGARLYRCSICGNEKQETIAALGHKEVIDVEVSPTCVNYGTTLGSHCETCGKVLIEKSLIPATGHIEKQISVTDSTCSLAGCIDYKCETCGETWSKDLPKLAHNLGDGVIIKNATCETQGLKEYTCLTCGQTEAEIIPSKGHTDGNVVITNNPGCLSEGSQSVYCRDCSSVIRTETISPLGHIKSDSGVVAKSVTCVENGSIEYRCTRCSDVLEVQTVYASGHSYGEYVTTLKPKCVEEGKKTHSCLICGYQEDDSIPALGHTEDDGVITTTPKCLADGIKTYTCTECHEITNTELVPALGHVEGEGAVTTEPQCLIKGVRTYYCSVCVDELRTESIPALGHNKSEVGVVTKEATCTENGILELCCTRCSAVCEIQSIFTNGHSYSEYITTLNPKCEEEGKKVHTCSICGDEEELSIPALGHNEDEGVVTDSPRCMITGTKTYSCTECNTIIRTVVVPALGHTENDGVITTQPDCINNGVKTYYCSVCADELRTESVAPLGHIKSEIGVVIQAVNCTTDGKTEYHCSRCEILMETQTVYSAGHNYDDGVVSVQPKCELSGTKVFTCLTCGNTENSVIPANGHTQVSIGSYIAPTCQNQGYTAGVKCSVCDSILESQTILAPTSHTYVGGVCSGCSIEEIYKVEFVSFGKTIAVEEYTVSNRKITEPELPEVDGYISKGWSNYALAGNITVNGIYEPRKYTITLYSGYGICDTKSMTVTFGSIGIQLPVPTYEEYIFVGWALSNTSDSKLFTNDQGVSIVNYDYAGNKHLYARYSSPRVEVLLDPDNGTSIIRTGFTYGSAFEYAAPEKEGAIFDGWFTEDGTEYTKSTLVKESVTLIAKWTESKAISTADELFAIADDPTANYHLTKDITLPNSNKVWTPIETFSGILNGLGHKIINIAFTTGDNATNFGFINTNNGIIENLSFSRVTFTQKITNGGNHNSGVICAINNGTIKDCHLLDGTVQYIINIDTISNEYSFGAISGTNNGSIFLSSNKLVLKGTFNAKYTDLGTVTDKMYFAGIAGINKGTISENSYIGELLVNSSTSGGRGGPVNHLHIGGLIGKNFSKVNNSYVDVDITIETSNTSSWNNCYFGVFVGVNNGGTIMNSFANGSFNGKGTQFPRIGGFVGLNENKGTIYNCYTTADVNPTSNGYIGGFVGYNNGANISGCYSSGDITATAGGTIGGFVGGCSDAGGLISNCYSCGNVIATSGGTVGLFVGSSGSTISDCYFMSDARLIISGIEYDIASEFDGAINGKFCYDMWSESFLTDDLFWTSEDGWIILTDEDPIFDWEIEIFHDYKTYTFEPTCEGYGYTLYLCNDCTRFFIRDVVEPIGHVYDYNNPEIKSATCTESGYVRYVCIREDCAKYSEKYKEKDRIYYESTTDPLDHTHVNENIVADKTYPATCKDDGETTYICDRCGEEYTVTVEKHGHINLYESQPRVEPSCTIIRTYTASDFDVSIKDIDYATDHHILTEGHTAQIKCKDCGALVEESVDIPHETLFTYTYTTEPTCTESGSGKYVCKCGWEEITSNIPALGHTDINNDHRCDKCHVLMVDKNTALESGSYIEISDVAGLKAIANDLNGIYQLTANIVWDPDKDGVWTPLGTEDKAFKGMLFGNGKTISGLKIADAEVGGLFAYNSGYIEDLTLAAPTIIVDGNGTVGGIAGYNSGTIYGCMITGNFTIKLNASLTTDTAKSNSSLYVQDVGGIVGVNEKLGIIDLCTSDAIFSIVFDHEASTTFGREHSLIIEYLKSLLNRGLQYKEFVTKSTLTVNFGTICGTMNGHSEINRCTVSGSVYFSGKVVARTEKYAGTARAELYINDHGIIGNSKNGATPTNCNFTLATSSMNISQSAENPKFGEIYYDCQTSIIING